MHVLDVDNGARFETYVIEGERGAGEMCLNGAAARLVQLGDRVIVVSYGVYSEEELERARFRGSCTSTSATRSCASTATPRRSRSRRWGDEHGARDAPPSGRRP